MNKKKSYRTELVSLMLKEQQKQWIQGRNKTPTVEIIKINQQYF